MGVVVVTVVGVVRLGFFLFVVVMMSPLQKGESGRCIDDIGRAEGIGQEVLQSGTGEDDHIGALNGLHLTDRQGVVVEAGDVLRHQTGDLQVRACGQAAGELPHGQGGGGDIGVLLRGASGQKQTEQEE